MRKQLGILAFAAAVLIGGPAFADAIDGDWCAPDGRHVRIAGSNITTSSGAQLTGSYSRHSFAYVAPAAEPEAGQTVNMQLSGETRVYVQTAGGGAPQVWRRCEHVS